MPYPRIEEWTDGDDVRRRAVYLRVGSPKMTVTLTPCNSTSKGYSAVETRHKRACQPASALLRAVVMVLVLHRITTDKCTPRGSRGGT